MRCRWFTRRFREPSCVVAGLIAAAVAWTLSANPASAADNTPPEGFTALFNGKDLHNWLPRDPRATSHWYVEDDVMVNTPPDIDLYTRQVFDDFNLHVEFKMDKNSNSGIYLRGRYEVQLLDDYGRGTESHGNGSVYSRIAPLKNASKPAGEWQTFDITLIGRWLTVVLNGETIIDNQHLDGITGGALDSFENMPGPIMVQGDHGRVWFRRISIRPAL